MAYTKKRRFRKRYRKYRRGGRRYRSTSRFIKRVKSIARRVNFRAAETKYCQIGITGTNATNNSFTDGQPYTATTLARPLLAGPVTSQGTNDYQSRVGDSITHKKTVIWGTIQSGVVVEKSANYDSLGVVLQSYSVTNRYFLNTRCRIICIKYKTLPDTVTVDQLPVLNDYFTTQMLNRDATANIGTATNVESDWLFDRLKINNIKILYDKVHYLSSHGGGVKRFKIKIKGRFPIKYLANNAIWPIKNLIACYAFIEDDLAGPKWANGGALYEQTFARVTNSDITMRMKTYYKDM